MGAKISLSLFGIHHKSFKVLRVKDIDILADNFHFFHHLVSDGNIAFSFMVNGVKKFENFGIFGLEHELFDLVGVIKIHFIEPVDHHLVGFIGADARKVEFLFFFAF